MKIRSAVPENGCLVFCGERKKQKNKKTSVKHIRIRLIGGCVNNIADIHAAKERKRKKHAYNKVQGACAGKTR